MVNVPGSESDRFGVYVHVPFCAKRCDYCAFATWTDRDHLMAAHSAATVREIDRAKSAGMRRPTSVFFGGGTPSLIPAEQLAAILAAIDAPSGTEVTVECNPDTATDALFTAYRRAGVTRISFGVQSMVDRVLVALGRSHDRANVERSVMLATRHGFDFNLDLIYGGAGESMQDWRDTVEAVIALEPTHISAYALTIEAGTPLAADPTRHPDDDDQVDKYLWANDRFAEAGLINYEISNWARAGHECRHNWLYWMQGEYLGFGCAAHSYLDGRRWWNLRTPERYIAASEAGESTEASGEHSDPDEKRIEGLQLSLRTRQGIPIEALSPVDREELAELLVETDDGRLVLTTTGRMLANEVAVRLL
jgi:putative oxygen-independent coproporphyrinogen III oxidase